MNKLLQIENLHTYFYTKDKIIKAVEGISFHVNKGEALGVVGESGCGKSVTGMSIMQLLQTPPAKYVKGKIVFKGRDLLDVSSEEIRKLRGKDISIIFQEPMSALNPVFTVGFQLEEVLKVHTDIDKKERFKKVYQIMEKVGLPDPQKRFNEYPHQLSGGMRQRIMIAMALLMKPELVIADEPTTALDVTIQKQVLDLMKELQKEMQLSLIFISHDLGVVKEIAQRIIVMYSGEIVEESTIEDIFKNPLHPYTRGLIDSIPPIEYNKKKEPLKSIPGKVPDPSNKPVGCPFYPRCEKRMDICENKRPDFFEKEPNHFVKCFLYEK